MKILRCLHVRELLYTRCVNFTLTNACKSLDILKNDVIYRFQLIMSVEWSDDLWPVVDKLREKQCSPCALCGFCSLCGEPWTRAAQSTSSVWLPVVWRIVSKLQFCTFIKWSLEIIVKCITISFHSDVSHKVIYFI